MGTMSIHHMFEIAYVPKMHISFNAWKRDGPNLFSTVLTFPGTDMLDMGGLQ